MKKWIKNNWQPLISFLFITLLFVVTSILKWGIIATIFSMVIFILLFIIILAWILDHEKK